MYKPLTLLVVLLLAAGSAHAKLPKQKKKKAKVASCEATAIKLIKAGYNEGGMHINKLHGPFVWNEPFFSKDGDPGIRHRIAFAVSFAPDKEFRKKIKPGTVLLVGECVEGEPSRLADTNRDKAVDLSDLKLVKPSGK